MSGHAFHQIYLHIVWHTKDEMNVLTPDLEKKVYAYIRNRCLQSPGVYLHDIGGTETHVHVALNIEPSVLISKLIGDLKGSSSHEITEHQWVQAFNWQRGYGCLSFARRDLAYVLDYIRNQKKHHANNTLNVQLEQSWIDEP
jgi:putative transposase